MQSSLYVNWPQIMQRVIRMLLIRGRCPENNTLNWVRPTESYQLKKASCFAALLAVVFAILDCTEQFC